MKNPNVFMAEPNTTCHGIDPEVFLEKDGKGLAAHQIGLPNSENRLALDEQGTWHFSLYRDGWAAEINTRYGGSCRAYIGNCVRYALYSLADMAKKHKAQLRFVSAMPVDTNTIANGPPDIRQIGCNPAMDAYTGQPTTPQNFDPIKSPFRTTGVHLHSSIGHAQVHLCRPVGWWEDFDNVRLFVKMADVYAGLPFTYLLGNKQSALRRKYYGLAGEYRIHDYDNRHKGTSGCGYLTGYKYQGGIEYRVPGGEVLCDHALVNMGFGVLRRLYLFFEDFAKVYDPKIGEQVRKAINNGVSKEDLLDLVQDCPGMYNKDVLRGMRHALYSKLDDTYLTMTGRTHPGWKDECHLGWYERVDRALGHKYQNVIYYNY